MPWNIHNYKIPDPPVIINFSGGRSSAAMTYHILAHYDGQLPDGVWVCFANTGKEEPETLDFVRDCELHWNLPIVWLEYRHEPWRKGGIKDPKHTFKVVDHATASRNGEPFDQVIMSHKALPGMFQRFCTFDLKINTIDRWLRRTHGIRQRVHVLGIRADEPKRLKKATLDNCNMDYPLARDGVTKQDVRQWWRDQPFDLQTENSNCDLCFMKRHRQLQDVVHDDPSKLKWWADWEKHFEKIRGRCWRTDWRHQDLTNRQPDLFDTVDNEFKKTGPNCFCGD